MLHEAADKQLLAAVKNIVPHITVPASMPTDPFAAFKEMFAKGKLFLRDTTHLVFMSIESTWVPDTCSFIKNIWASIPPNGLLTMCENSTLAAWAVNIAQLDLAFSTHKPLGQPCVTPEQFGVRSLGRPKHTSGTPFMLQESCQTHASPLVMQTPWVRTTPRTLAFVGAIAEALNGTWVLPSSVGHEGVWSTAEEYDWSCVGLAKSHISWRAASTPLCEWEWRQSALVVDLIRNSTDAIEWITPDYVQVHFSNTVTVNTIVGLVRDKRAVILPTLSPRLPIEGSASVTALEERLKQCM